MIIYQGWGDIARSPYRTLQYYLGLRRHHGRRAVEDYARLFTKSRTTAVSGAEKGAAPR